MMNNSTPDSHLLPRKAKRVFKTYTQAQKDRFVKKIKTHGVGMDTLMIFSQQLAAMLKAGLPIVEAMQALESQIEDPVFALILQDVYGQVQNGVPFSAALAKFPKTFPTMFTSMAEAGEASGLLAEMMEKVAAYLKSAVGLMKKVKSALVYPAVVISMSVLLVVVLMVFVIPVFQDMFDNFGAKLPLPTQILINISDFFQNYILFIVVFGIGMVLGLKRFFESEKGKRIRDKIVYRLPIAGPLSAKVAVARFCRTYGILLKSGVSLLKCIQICSNASDNTFIQEACKTISRVVNQGGQLSEAILDEPYFPLVMVQMVKAGEKTGNVDAMLNSVAEFFETEIDNTIGALTSILEPFMIAFLGTVVGAIVVAMFLPIFQLSSVVST